MSVFFTPLASDVYKARTEVTCTCVWKVGTSSHVTRPRRVPGIQAFRRKIPTSRSSAFHLARLKPNQTTQLDHVTGPIFSGPKSNRVFSIKSTAVLPSEMHLWAAIHSVYFGQLRTTRGKETSILEMLFVRGRCHGFNKLEYPYATDQLHYWPAGAI